MLINRERFIIEVTPGSFVLRTRRRCFLALFGYDCQLLPYKATGHRWAYIQLGDKTIWLMRSR